MIARLLSRLSDLRDARQLARTVHVQAEQIDALQTLAAHLAEQLEIAETAAEEYRARVEALTAPVGDHVAECAADLRECAAAWDPDVRLLGNLTAREIAEVARRAMRAPVEPPRDAQALENRVLSLCQGWAADRERDTAARLNAAEVELAAAREALRQADAALTSEREGRRAAEQSWSRERTKVTALRSKLAEERAAHDMSRHLAGVNATEARAQIEGLRIGLEAAVERGRRWERHARALARTAHMAVGMMGPARLALARGCPPAIRAREGRDDTRPEHDAPPPTQPSERRAPTPPSPPRFRVTAGGDR